VGLAAVLVAGGIFASNMGFKLNYALNADADGAGPDNGTNSLALPYNQQTNITDAKVLCDDIELGTPGSVISVARYLKASNGLDTYDCASGTAFAITPGEGYRVQMSLNASYIVVGSHDPGLGIDLLADADAAGPDNGTNSFSMPYHSTLMDAKGLCDEIELVTPGSVISVARYLKATNGLDTYDCSSGTAFTLTPGEAYRVQMSLDAIGYIPSHF
jgi:hypothetical protein